MNEIDNQADYLDALAAAIRTVNERLDGITRTDLEARLGVGGAIHDSMGVVPRSLLGTGPVAASLGGTEPFVRHKNYLRDVTFETIPSADTILGTTETAIGPSWSGHYALISGTAPSVLPTVYIGAGRGSFNNNFASQMLEVFADAIGETGVIEIYVYPSNQDQFLDTSTLPYIVASVGLTRLSGANWDAASSATMELELQEDDFGDWVTRATSPAQDAHDIGGSANLLRSFVAASLFTGTNRWRPRFKITFSYTGVDNQLYLDFGEPQLTFAYTPDAQPFQPAIAGWVPSTVEAYADAAAAGGQPSVMLDRRGLRFWSGAASFTKADVRLRRSAAKELTIDDDAAGPVRLKVVGTRVATPKATQTLAAATAIVADYEVVQISSAGAITSTAAPTVADGVDGQMLLIVNVGAFNITIQNQGTLAGSNLRLTAASVALTPRDSVQLMYSATVGDWIQVGNLVNVL